MFATTRFAIVAALTVMLLATPPVAQTAEMTVEEITRAFENHKTRGLTLIPAPDAEAAPDSAGTTISGTAPALTPAPVVAITAPAASGGTKAATVAYQPVDPGDQVNIQIGFGFDSAVMQDDQKAKLVTMCEVMKAVDVEIFQIIGHTDAAGPAVYNENLSLLRAQEVKRHLVSECGIAEDRLQAVGMGKNAPVNPDDPFGDENRRVEFQALV